MQKVSVPFGHQHGQRLYERYAKQLVASANDQRLAKAAETEELRPAVEQSGDRDRKG